MFIFTGDKADLFSGALYNNYQAPDGFCFDILCNDQPIIDGKHSPDNNVKEKVRIVTVKRYYPFLYHCLQSYNPFIYQILSLFCLIAISSRTTSG